MKKCRPVVKGPSGGTLLFCFALPARGASILWGYQIEGFIFASALPARGASRLHLAGLKISKLCLGAACTGCIGISRQIAAHHFVAYAVSR